MRDYQNNLFLLIGVVVNESSHENLFYVLRSHAKRAALMQRTPRSRANPWLLSCKGLFVLMQSQNLHKKRRFPPEKLRLSAVRFRGLDQLLRNR